MIEERIEELEAELLEITLEAVFYKFNPETDQIDIVDLRKRYLKTKDSLRELGYDFDLEEMEELEAILFVN